MWVFPQKALKCLGANQGIDKHLHAVWHLHFLSVLLAAQKNLIWRVSQPSGVGCSWLKGRHLPDSTHGSTESIVCSKAERRLELQLPTVYFMFGFVCMLSFLQFLLHCLYWQGLLDICFRAVLPNLEFHRHCRTAALTIVDAGAGFRDLSPVISGWDLLKSK